MNYAEMSDFSIAESIVKTLSLEDCEMWCAGTKPDSDNGWGIIITNDDDESWRYFNPCNNPADMWPLIVDNSISVFPFGGHGVWMARHGNFSSLHKNPLRAAAIVYLMMKEVGE